MTTLEEEEPLVETLVSAGRLGALRRLRTTVGAVGLEQIFAAATALQSVIHHRAEPTAETVTALRAWQTGGAGREAQLL